MYEEEVVGEMYCNSKMAACCNHDRKLQVEIEHICFFHNALLLWQDLKTAKMMKPVNSQETITNQLNYNTYQWYTVDLLVTAIHLLESGVPLLDHLLALGLRLPELLRCLVQRNLT